MTKGQFLAYIDILYSGSKLYVDLIERDDMVEYLSKKNIDFRMGWSDGVGMWWIELC